MCAIYRWYVHKTQGPQKKDHMVSMLNFGRETWSLLPLVVDIGGGASDRILEIRRCEVCISMGHVLDDKTDYSRLIRDQPCFFFFGR